MFKCFKKNRIFKRQASMMLVFAMLIFMMTGLWTAPVLEVQAAETGVNWTKANINKTTTAGTTLANGYMYSVTENVTLTGAAATSSVDAVNGLRVAAGAAVVLYIPKGVTLTVTGGNGYLTKPGAAGIEVPSTSTLIIIGGGTLSATGGNAGAAGSGEKGGNGSIASNTEKSGYGGAGGSGGGGAGAGIGTNGGAGGAGGIRTGIASASLWGNSPGLNGNPGGNGTSASASGTVRIAATVSGTYKGGTSTGSNGSGGGKGSTATYTSGNKAMACGGGGGGGGGVGYAANNIGYGGSGGPGGGSGGSGGVDAAPGSANLANLCEGYGGGGTTSSNGGTSGVTRISGSYFTKSGGKGGSAGTANNNLVTSYTYRNPGLNDCASINYNVTFINTEVADIQDQNLTLTLGLVPGELAIADKLGYDFVGYYTEENGVGTQPFDSNGSVNRNSSYSDADGLWLGTESLTLYAHYLPEEEPQYNYSFEPLNNVVNEDDELTKKVSGDSRTDNGTNTSLQVELQKSDQAISVYKIADVAWDDVAHIYEYPAWISVVKAWINDPARKSEDFLKNKSAFVNPLALASTSSDVQESFFIDMANDKSLLDTIGVVKAPDSRLSDTDGEETKYYALFENLTFGTYLICADGYNPVVKNIYPDKDASGYTVPTLVKATLKGGGLGLEKKINGHDIDTVAVGDIVNFEISFAKPANTEITDESEIILTDVMSNAFSLKQDSSIEISSDPEGNSPLKSGIDYSIGTTTTNEDGSTNIPITFAANRLRTIDAERIYIKYSAIVTKYVKYNSESNYNTAILKVDRLSCEDTVRAYTYGLTVVKVDGNSVNDEEGMTYLSGAEFNLFKEKYIYIGGEFAGAFYEGAGINYIKDGVTEPNADFIEVCKADPKQYYVYEYEAEASGSIVVDQKKVQYEKDAAIVRIYELVTNGVGFSDDNGTITSVASQEGVTIGGLDSGSYILLETRAPSGYNALADDIYFEINRMTEDEAKLKAAGSLSAFYEMNETEKLNESGKVELVVLNFRGLTLPSTGGNGILLFSILGMLLMIMALTVAVVRSRRVNTYDF